MYEGGSPFIVPRAESDNRQKTNSLFIDRTYVRFDWCLLRTRQSPVQCNFSFFKYVLVLLILFPPQKTIPPLTPTSKNFFLDLPLHPSPFTSSQHPCLEMQPPFILVKIFSCCRPNYPLCTNSIFFVTRVYKRSLFAYLNVALLINLFISSRTPTPPLSSLHHLILRRRHISLNKR
jgi:hypothetical protein